MPNPISVDLRQRAVDAYLNGEGSFAEVAQRFCISSRSLTRWVALVRAGESLAALPHSGGASRRKIQEHHKQALAQWVEEQPDIYLRELAQKLMEHYQLSLTTSMISRTLKQMGLTSKKTYIDTRQNRPDVQNERGLFKWMLKVLIIPCLELMIWVDETATYMDMTRRRGRAPSGKRVKHTKRRKYRRHTLVMAINATGVVACALFQGAMSTENWRCFCGEHLAPQCSKGTLIQLDNLDIHYDQEAYDAIFAKGAVLIFQPPYSPESNPIEEVFSLLKEHLRQKQAKTLKELRQAIQKAVEQLTHEYIGAYISHAHQLIEAWDVPEII